jgi:hypothetical protein
LAEDTEGFMSRSALSVFVFSIFAIRSDAATPSEG